MITMNEINLSIYDRNLFEQIRYNLEVIANSFEQNKPDWYEINAEGTIINLKIVQALSKCNTNPFIYLYIGGYNEGEMTYTKKFKSIEARDAEYERLKEKLMKK